MIKKMIRKIARAKTFVVLLTGLDTGFSVINGLLTHKPNVRKNADFAGAKLSYREAAPLPARPILVQTLRPPMQMAAQPVSERPLKKRSG
jgi:hypothetical protein